jgi:hypothetical protein
MESPGGAVQIIRLGLASKRVVVVWVSRMCICASDGCHALTASRIVLLNSAARSIISRARMLRRGSGSNVLYPKSLPHSTAGASTRLIC